MKSEKTQGPNLLLIKIFFIVTFFSSLVFTFFNIPLHADISILSFFLSLIATLVTAFFFTQYAFSSGERKRFYFKAAQKSLQYLPYLLLVAFILRRSGALGTPYWFDFVTVLLWCLSLVARWGTLSLIGKSAASLPQKKNKPKGAPAVSPSLTIKKTLYTVLDWVDALIQAVFMVLLIQIFIFQLYVIPSESMVPQFLIGDRVVVSKILSAPKFPLSDVGLPRIKTLKRGDIVVFRNPHYTIDRKSEVKGVLSQMIYMMTFTLVNLNKDENGQIKYDPLVKRVIGLPGECLVMQDGTLYKKSSDDPHFRVVEDDRNFASWNLNDENQNIKLKIHDLPLTPNQYQGLLKIEEERRGLSIKDAKATCLSLDIAIRQLSSEWLKSHERKTEEKTLSLISYDIFNNYKEISAGALNGSYGEGLSRFLTDWVEDKEEEANARVAGIEDTEGENSARFDPYQNASYKLNLMIKLTAGRLYERYGRLLVNGASEDEIIYDKALNGELKKANELYMTILLQDQRNMCVFPAPDEDGRARYIPSDCYFMMGDNRFNSLDLRHSYETKLTSLTPFDKYSAQYHSNLAPQAVNQKYILGNAIFRFWPLDRAGLIK